MIYFDFGNLLMVLRQRVQILTVRITPLISMRRRWTFNTKRRRVRFCEKGTLLPCMGLRSHISQRPDIWIILSFFIASLALKGLRPLGGNALTPPAPGDHWHLSVLPTLLRSYSFPLSQDPRSTSL